MATTVQPRPVSVIVPVHNRADLLQEALASVAAQRPAPPAEVVVIDDGSTDDSADRARRAGATVIQLPTNGGPGPARNEGLRRASQPWCAFLDSDDVWADDHLETLLAAADPGTGLVASSSVVKVNGAPRVAANPYRRRRRLNVANDVLAPESVVTTSACMVRTDVALAVGGFADTPVVEDLDLWLRVVDAAGGLVLPEITVRYGPANAVTGRNQASADVDGMRRYARELLARHPGLRPVNRHGVKVCVAWDSLRIAIRERAPGSAAEALPTILIPPSWSPLMRILVHRRARRVRWRTQPEAVRRLFEARP